MTTGKDDLAEVFKKGCIVKCYYHVDVVGNQAWPGCYEGERLGCNPNKLINDTIVGDVRVVDRIMQTSLEIFTHVDKR